MDTQNTEVQPVSCDAGNLSTLDSLRNNVDSSIGQLKSLLNNAKASINAATGDAGSLTPPSDPSDFKDLKEVLRDLKTLGFDRIEDLAEVMKTANLGRNLDDKPYYLERLIQSAAMLPDATVSKKITNTFLTTLWDDLEHPPRTLLHDKYQFRQPDGSLNSWTSPQLGAAGSPYARTVTSKTMQVGRLPDPGVLFDTLMARKEPKGTPHPAKISSMLFNLASIIIHDAFKTNRRDYNISDTSSYLDLAPLYGSNWTDQKAMRTMKDGKIKPDCFSETRLLSFPPGVGALLILFNRYHNYVVEQLAAINENGRFTEDARCPLVERYGESINKRDDDLFQTGRLITCGLYVHIILIDYVRTILNLNRTDHDWKLDPRTVIPDGPPMGTGNQVSAEFNLVYRWHAAISNRDDLWTQELFRELFPDVTPHEVADSSHFPAFMRRLGELDQANASSSPDKRPFPALERERLQRSTDEGPSKGSYKDDDLAAIITASIEDCANAMGPQQVPTVMKAVEMLGIKQARSWKLATLNEFRQHFSLEPHKTFESITANKEVAEALEHLYGSPDKVELYPGLQIEDAKKPMLPGSGLCPSYTVSRAVLSDAVALVRGDRFYTNDFTPVSLTNWGFQEVSSNTDIDNGCVFYKLLLRALPDMFDSASVYAHYPFTVPNGDDGMKDVLQRLGKAHKYNFDKPARTSEPTMLLSYDSVKQVCDDRETYGALPNTLASVCTGAPKRVSFAEKDATTPRPSSDVILDVLHSDDSDPTKSNGDAGENWLRAIQEFHEETTTNLLRDRSYRLAGISQVDLVRHIGDVVPVHFVSDLFSLPLKTVQYPQGVFTESQMHQIVFALSTSILREQDPLSTFHLHEQAREALQLLDKFMQLQCSAIQTAGVIASTVIDTIKPTHTFLTNYGAKLLARLIEKEPNIPRLVRDNILTTLGATVTTTSTLFAQILDYLLSPEAQPHLSLMHDLAEENSAEADLKMSQHIREITRLTTRISLTRLVRHQTTLTDAHPSLPEPRTHHLEPGSKVILNLAAASHDPTHYPDPEVFSLDRDPGSYLHLEALGGQCLGTPALLAAMVGMVKAVVRLEGLRKGKGSTLARVKVAGRRKVDLDDRWGQDGYLTEEWDRVVPFASGLMVNWDVHEVAMNGHANGPKSGNAGDHANGDMNGDIKDETGR